MANSNHKTMSSSDPVVALEHKRTLTLADIPEGSQICGSCRLYRRGSECDMEARLGRGCTYCKVHDKMCHYIFDDHKTPGGFKRKLTMSPRPDGMVFPLCCDQCARTDIKGCSWRRSSTISVCVSCRSQGLSCSHGGIPAGAATAGHTHFDLTKRLILEGKKIGEKQSAPRRDWESDCVVFSGDQQLRAAPPSAATVPEQHPQKPKTSSCDVTMGEGRSGNAKTGNSTISDSKTNHAQDRVEKVSVFLDPNRCAVTMQSIPKLYPVEPRTMSVRTRSRIPTNPGPALPLFFEEIIPNGEPVKYPHPNPSAISALCTIPMFLMRDLHQKDSFIGPCSERKVVTSAMKPTQPEKQQSLPSPSPTPPAPVRCNKPAARTCWDTAHDACDEPVCEACHYESIRRYFKLGIPNITRPGASMAEVFAHHIRVYACSDCTRSLIQALKDGYTTDEHPLPAALCNRRIWSSKHLVPQAPKACDVGCNPPSTPHAINANSVKQNNNPATAAPRQGHQLRDQVMALELLTGCSCGVKLFAPFTSEHAEDEKLRRHLTLAQIRAGRGGPSRPPNGSPSPKPYTFPIICAPHRLQRIAAADAAAEEMRRWLEATKTTDVICPLCVRNVGVPFWRGVLDLEEFAGEQLDYIAWGCLVCHEVAIARKNPNFEHQGRRFGDPLFGEEVGCLFKP